MADKNQPTGSQGEYYPPPPPGPPPGHNGLAMHPNDYPIPEPQSELYDYPPPPLPPPSAQQQQQQQQHQQQTPHQQTPPSDGDSSSKKAGWGQRFAAISSKAAVPFNALANKLGAEAFLPSTMDKEVEKASRILRAFCKDGIYTDAQAPETVEAPTTDAEGKPKKNRTLLTIPSKVINRAVGLAIFTTARAGFHISGATGSGILVSRLPDGSWSPPSGIQVHSVGAGFVVGIDIYDCVVVINTREALEAFTQTRMSLGSDLAVVAGPWGAGGSVDFATPQGKDKGKGKGRDSPELPKEPVRDAGNKPATPTVADHNSRAEYEGGVPTVSEPGSGKTEEVYDQQGPAATRDSQRPQAGKERKPSAIKNAMKQPTYSYVKSRGFYAGVQVDGTIITERKDANAAFYGGAVSVQQILRGEVARVPGRDSWISLVQPLFDTIKGAQGWHSQQQGSGSTWANQMGPDPNSTYGMGNAPAAYPSDRAAGENPPQKPPRPAYGNNMAGAAAGVAAMSIGEQGASSTTAASGETPLARAKAAEAADEAEMNREREARERRELEEGMAREGRNYMAGPPPGYSELAPQVASGAADGGQEQPPAYVDDGAAAAAAARAGAGDSKGGQSS